jgi:hypothetical protein
MLDPPCGRCAFPYSASYCSKPRSHVPGTKSDDGLFRSTMALLRPHHSQPAHGLSRMLVATALATALANPLLTACGTEGLEQDSPRQVGGALPADVRVDFPAAYAIRWTSTMKGTVGGKADTMVAKYYGILTTTDVQEQSARFGFQICDTLMPKLNKMGMEFQPEIASPAAIQRASTQYTFDAALRDRGNGQYGLDLGKANAGEIEPLSLNFATAPEPDFDGDGKPGLTLAFSVFLIGEIELYMGFKYKLGFDTTYKGSALVANAVNDSNYAMQSVFHGSNKPSLASREAFDNNYQRNTAYSTAFVGIPQKSLIRCSDVRWRESKQFDSDAAFSTPTPISSSGE